MHMHKLVNKELLPKSSWPEDTVLFYQICTPNQFKLDWSCCSSYWYIRNVFE